MTKKIIFNSISCLNYGAKCLNVRNCSSCPKEKTGYPFLILRATKDDYDEVLRLMRKAYYREEPTCRALAYKPTTVLENQTIQTLNQGLSFVAKCKYNGNVLGACINEATNPWDPDTKDRLACMVKCIKTRKLLKFYAFIQRLPNIWDIYDVPQVFEMAYLFVNKEDRGKGLALKLMEMSRCLAADCTYSIVRVDATSYYTAKLCEKMRMKLLCEIPYSAYLDANEQPVFHPVTPHTSCKIYVDDEIRRFKKK